MKGGSLNLKQMDCEIFSSKDRYIRGQQRITIPGSETIASLMHFPAQQGRKETFMGEKKVGRFSEQSLWLVVG